MFKQRPEKREQGFTLVEILVAIVVLSIGLLGLAGLQANSLKFNNSAYQRSVASMMAYDMLDRIRANRDGMAAGHYNTYAPGGFPSEPSCATSGGCTSTADMADYDAYQWSSQLSNLLPSGTGRVAGNGADSIFTITVMWDDQRTGATDTDCGGDPDTDLTCFFVSTRM